MSEVEILPKYQVEKLEGTIKVRKAKYRVDLLPILDENEEPTGKHRKVARGFEFYEKEEPAGYMVYCPRGHSFRCSEDELKRLNLNPNRRPPKVLMDGGDEVPEGGDIDLRARVQAKALKRKI